MKNTLVWIGFAMVVSKKDGNADVGEIGYGTSFGMCTDYCVNDIALDATEVKFTKKAWN